MPAGAVDIDGAVHLALDLAERTAAGEPEVELARTVCTWARDHSLPATLQPVGHFGTNVLIGPDSGPELAFYGHLDTSLRLGPWDDVLLVSDPSPPPPPSCDGETLWGAGIGVALAPTTAALSVVASLSDALGPGRVGALIASGGTHRAPPPWPAQAHGPMHAEMGAGVRAALGSGFRPGAVLSPKGGAPAPLWEEPGSLYIAVALREEYGPALTRPPGGPLAGAPAATAAAIASIAEWRADYIARVAGREGQAGAEAAIGALQAGSPSKPDVLPDTARIYVYVVTVPGDDDSDVTGSLREHLRSDPALCDLAVDVSAYGRLPAGATEPTHPLVQAVNTAWRSRLPLQRVTGWRGSTDGALLRSEGVPTVRAGPPLLRHPDDPRVEGVKVADLDVCCQIWREAAAVYLDS